SEEQLLAPDGIIPHAFDQQRALKYLIEWVKSNKIKPEKQVDLPRGVYLPLWSFDLGGEIDYVGAEVDESNIQFKGSYPRTIRINGSYPVQMNDIPIPA